MLSALLLLTLPVSCMKPAAKVIVEQQQAETVSQPEDEALEGKVEVFNDTNVYFILNWKSRSKVRLAVTGPKTDDIRSLADSVIRIRGNVIKKSPWSGSIEVTEILP